MSRRQRSASTWRGSGCPSGTAVARRRPQFLGPDGAASISSSSRSSASEVEAVRLRVRECPVRTTDNHPASSTHAKHLATSTTPRRSEPPSRACTRPHHVRRPARPARHARTRELSSSPGAPSAASSGRASSTWRLRIASVSSKSQRVAGGFSVEERANRARAAAPARRPSARAGTVYGRGRPDRREQLMRRRRRCEHLGHRQARRRQPARGGRRHARGARRRCAGHPVGRSRECARAEPGCRRTRARVVTSMRPRRVVHQGALPTIGRRGRHATQRSERVTACPPRRPPRPCAMGRALASLRTRAGHAADAHRRGRAERRVAADRPEQPSRPARDRCVRARTRRTGRGPRSLEPTA